MRPVRGSTAKGLGKGGGAANGSRTTSGRTSLRFDAALVFVSRSDKVRDIDFHLSGFRRRYGAGHRSAERKTDRLERLIERELTERGDDLAADR